MDKVIVKKNTRLKKLLLYGVPVLVLAGLVFGFLSKAQKHTLNVSAANVVLDTVKTADFEEFIPVDGTIVPLKTILIDAAEGGTVAERVKDEGSMVQKGDPLVKLTNSTLQLDFMNKEAQLLDQENNMRNTRISLEQNHLNLKQQLLDIEHSYIEQKRIYERNKILYREKTIATADYEKIEDSYFYLVKKKALLEKTVKQDSVFKASQITQLESGIELIRQNLAMVKQNLENLTIKAPVTGLLTSLNAEIGETKQKGQNIGQIDIQAGFKITANVDEHYISRISKGLKGSFLLDDKSYTLVVTKVLPQVTNGQFKIELGFEDNKIPAGIKQGQTLQIKLTLGKKNQALVIKTGGFYSKTGGAWIFVMNGSKAEKTPIKIGRQNPDYYEITQGLKPGDIVVSSSYETYGNADELNLQK